MDDYGTQNVEALGNTHPRLRQQTWATKTIKKKKSLTVNRGYGIDLLSFLKKMCVCVRVLPAL